MSEGEDESAREVDVGSSKWRIVVKAEDAPSGGVGEQAQNTAPPIAVVTIEVLSWTPGGTRVSLPVLPEYWSHSSLMTFLVTELERCRDCFE